MTTRLRHTVLPIALPALLIALVAVFSAHAISRGLSLGSVSEQATSWLHRPDAPLSNLSIYGHMILGGVITALAPLQLIGPLRRRWPRAHHTLGYTVAALALLTAFGGCFYIALSGTIGGAPMNAGFALYGALMALAAVQTLRFARQRDPRHRDWALRLMVLVMGSWIYRVHYGLWYLLMDGAGSNRAFTGPFDVAQTVLFYAPYLLALELWLRRRNAGPTPAFVKR